ncbi:MAG: SDR family NAD(P)-dependent oxidoreductase [Evtepia sp.]
MGKLTGKVALVTGGARGIGRAYALHLASLGADVGIIDIDLKSYTQFDAEKALMTADTTMDEIRAMGVRSAGATADISNKDQVFAAVRQIEEELGDIAICVCNAGGGSGTSTTNTASTMDFDQWNMVMGRNLFGTAYTVYAVSQSMKKNGYGKIITVSSQNAVDFDESGGYCHYGTAKAGIRAYTILAATKLGKYGIAVNRIVPGYIATGRLNVGFSKPGVSEVICKRTSLRRLGTPEDCAKVIEFLATDLSDFVTGATIEVTGGTEGKLGNPL